jgi:hypothetical protein
MAKPTAVLTMTATTLMSIRRGYTQRRKPLCLAIPLPRRRRLSYLHRDGNAVFAFMSSSTATLVLFQLLVLFSLLSTHSLCRLAVDAFQLTPSTPPMEVLKQQLSALKDDDITTVYRFASPNNKRQVGSIDRFDQMIRSNGSPYKHLIGHTDAQILLESNIMQSKQYLVRIITTPSRSKQEPTSNDMGGLGPKNDRRQQMMSVYDYWWSMSRCQGGDDDGSFMVDAVLPNL